MSRLSSFTRDANVAVVGASGGIGRAFCELLVDEPGLGRIYELSRSTGRPAVGDGRVTRRFIDIEDESTIAAAADAIATDHLDLVLVATGLLHRGESVRPERRLDELDPASAAEVFAVNALGPSLVAKHFLPKLRRRGKTVFAALSARVGSIADNRLGGWASYRAAKAALNQFVRTIAIENKRLRPDSVVVTLHPGTVGTSLSKPFTSRTASSSLFVPQQAAAYLLDVVDGLTSDQTGGFFAWDGTEIEY